MQFGQLWDFADGGAETSSGLALWPGYVSLGLVDPGVFELSGWRYSSLVTRCIASAMMSCRDFVGPEACLHHSPWSSKKS